MSIPKRISYCWFGGNPLPDRVKKCIDSWKRICPDYEIIRWDEKNYNINKIPFIKEAYKEKKWAFVADYARLDIIYEIGGIYLDTDVELIKRPDELLILDAFMCIDKEKLLINTGLGFGAKPGNIIIKELMGSYHNASFYKADGTFNQKACTIYTTEYFMQYGYVKEDKRQIVKEISIFPSEYLCPMDYETGKIDITNNTIGIHWYDASWLSKSDKKIHNIEANIKGIFPKKVALIMCKIYRNSYRFLEYTSKGILWKKAKRKILKK